MVFASIVFLYYYLPLVLIAYFFAPHRAKNTVLLLASLFFYFYGEPVYLILMLIAAYSAYRHGLYIDKFRGRKYARLLLVSSLVVSIGLLVFFKYADFLLANINVLFNTNFARLNLVQPIGISFYTFQILSYTIEVYRDQVKVQKSFAKFLLYVSFFPQLIAGPIVRYTTVAADLESRTHSWVGFAGGVRRFIIGLAKKVLLANVLGELCSSFKMSDEKSVLFFWLYALAFTLQIYFDFSGYSDMAIGMGKFFGFRFPENFNYPYIAKSITEFWRRWHISLSTWFRDFLYIPLGGNRVSTPRWLFNVLVVWLATGLWHGAAWNFVVWGLAFACLLVLEKYFLRSFLSKLPPFLVHFYVIFCVMLSFFIFNAESINDALSSLRAMLGLAGLPLCSTETLYYLQSYAVVISAAVVGSTPLPKLAAEKLKSIKHGRLLINLAEPVVLTALLLIVTAYLVDGSFNPFLYFRF